MPRRQELNYRVQLSPSERAASFREIAVTIRRSVSTVVAAWRTWMKKVVHSVLSGVKHGKIGMTNDIIIVFVWEVTTGAIAFGTRNTLLVIRGNMIGQRYVEVLRPAVVPYIGGIDEGIVQQDNARPQIARASLRFLQDEHISLLPWRGRLSDL
ncbi:hypothetical protein ABEB36_002970 [Hypothenemus hampei]|uniref:Transposase n=1 Tax=Hypothenemus hampei TaxID=57062 RepID=A0ABD1FA85_HYPHA